MKISDLLVPADVMIDVRTSGKPALLQNSRPRRRPPRPACRSGRILSSQAGRIGVDRIGKGVAIPHARLPGLQRPYGLSPGSNRRSNSTPSTPKRSISSSFCCCRGRRDRRACRAGTGRPDVEGAGHPRPVAGCKECVRALFGDRLTSERNPTGNHQRSRRYFPATREKCHGTKIFQDGAAKVGRAMKKRKAGTLKSGRRAARSRAASRQSRSACPRRGPMERRCRRRRRRKRRRRSAPKKGSGSAVSAQPSWP